VCLHTVKRSARDRKKGRKGKKSEKVGHDSRGRKMAEKRGEKGRGRVKSREKYKYRTICT
jgi:hypothetical protein